MTQGWETKKLGDVCEINYGTRVVQKKDGGTIYPVYGGGGATFKMDRYNREDCVVVARFAMSNQCVRYVQGKFFLNDSGLSVRTKEEKLSQEYLDKCIFSLNDKIYSLGKGVAQKNLDMKEFRHLDINYPCSKDEQSRIVEELDQLSNIIEKKRQQLSELDNLAQSIFYDMFGDIYENKYAFEIKELNEVFEFIKDGTHQTPQYVDEKEGVKFLSAKDVVKGFIDWNNIKYISDELHLQLSKRVSPQRDDILLCKNGTYGICALVETDDVFDIYVSLALMRPKKEYCPRFLVYAINNPITKEQFDKSIKGVGVPNLHLGEIKKAKIIIPPLQLQQLFAQKIEEIEKEKELIKQSIKETEELFNSRMDYYFG